MNNDTSTATNGEMSNVVVPPTETVNTSGTGETPAATTPDALAKELADLKTALKKANAEAASYRHKAKEYDDSKARLEAEKLTETERLQKQYNDLKAQHDEAIQTQFENDVRHRVSMEAAKLGVDGKVLDRVARFLDWEEIDVDADGQPTNIAALVEQLVNDIPGLRRSTPTPTSGGATNPQRSTTTAPQELSWAVIGNMKAEEYAARSAEIQRWILAHPPGYGQRMR